MESRKIMTMNGLLEIPGYIPKGQALIQLWIGLMFFFATVFAAVLRYLSKEGDVEVQTFRFGLRNVESDWIQILASTSWTMSEAFSFFVSSSFHYYFSLLCQAKSLSLRPKYNINVKALRPNGVQQLNDTSPQRLVNVPLSPSMLINEA